MLVRIDRAAGQVGRQLERGIREQVQAGSLRAGTRMPSSRDLATALGLSRGVVLDAYGQLVAEGYLVARRGSGTTVAPGRVRREPVSPGRASAARSGARRDLRADFTPGVPDLRLFPLRAWLRCLRRAAERSADLLNYAPSAGLPAARSAIAQHLNGSRATATTAESLIVTTGFTQAFQLTVETLRARGMRRLGIETPSHVFFGRLLAECAVTVVPIPVDDDGVQVARLAKARVDAILVTPAHQYPTGAVLSSARRTALLEWATRAGGVIIEDDYDGEFRYDRDPVGALHGLAPQSVAYIGSASKMLAPGLRLGWVALPAHLVDHAIAVKRRADLGSAALEQAALAEFIGTGELTRHVRRMRLAYRHRRDSLIAALSATLPDLEVRGGAAGLHVLLQLPAGVDESHVLQACAAHGLRVCGATRHYADARSATPGLVLGFGSIRSEDMAAEVTALRNAIGDAGRVEAHAAAAADARRR